MPLPFVGLNHPAFRWCDNVVVCVVVSRRDFVFFNIVRCRYYKVRSAWKYRGEGECVGEKGVGMQVVGEGGGGLGEVCFSHDWGLDNRYVCTYIHSNCID